MPSECAGVWQRSMINGTIPDGEIEIIDIVDGDFIGTHAMSNKPLIGSCVGGASPHIRFNVINHDERCIYTYSGEVILIDDVYHIRNGKRLRRCIPIDRGIRVVPDDWTAEKPT